jgi:hypothetical protein
VTMLLAFMTGPTHVGKSTAIRRICEIGDGQDGRHQVGTVEVGRMMRAKYLDPASPHYTPDKFKGQAAPKETQAEAWQMLLDGIERCRGNGDTVVLIDGQPRDYQQVYGTLQLPDARAYVSLFAPIAERERRFEASERASNPEDRSLSERRMRGDLTMLYEVLSILHLAGEAVRYFDTSADGYTPDLVYAWLAQRAESAGIFPYVPPEGPQG